MKTVTDIVGLVFADLTVVKRSPTKLKRTLWECICVCGNTTIVDGTKLKSGHTKSCGCYLKRFCKTHGEAGANRSKEYSTWAAMIKRCRNKNDKKYKHYGGRGIRVCDRWLKFENFIEDMGVRPPGRLSLDRYPNNDGNYEPENCRWATYSQQNYNKRKNIKYEVAVT